MDAVWQFIEGFGVLLMSLVFLTIAATVTMIAIARLTHHQKAADRIARRAYSATWILRFGGDGHN